MVALSSVALTLLTLMAFFALAKYSAEEKATFRFGSLGFLVIVVTLFNVVPIALGVFSGSVTRTTLFYGNVLVTKAPWVDSLERLSIVATGLVAGIYILNSLIRKNKILITSAAIATLSIVCISLLGSVSSGFPIFAVRSIVLIILFIAIFMAASGESDGPGTVISGAAIATVAVSILSGLLFIVDRASAVRTCRDDKCGALGQLYQGVFPNENALALILVAGLPFVLIAAKRSNAMRIAALQVVLSVLIAGSRSGQLALGFCLLSFIIWRGMQAMPAQKSIRLIALQTLCIAGVSAQVLVPVVAPADSLTNRPTLWRFALEQTSQSPILGRGWNSLEQIFKNEGAIEGVSSYSAHNQLLDVYLVSGIAGCMIFVVFLGMIIFRYSSGHPELLLILATSLWLGVLERPWNYGYLDWMSGSMVAALGAISWAAARYKKVSDHAHVEFHTHSLKVG